MGEENEGIELSERSLEALAARGLSLQVSIYGPDPDCHGEVPSL